MHGEVCKEGPSCLQFGSKFSKRNLHIYMHVHLNRHKKGDMIKDGTVQHGAANTGGTREVDKGILHDTSATPLQIKFSEIRKEI